MVMLMVCKVVLMYMCSYVTQYCDTYNVEGNSLLILYTYLHFNRYFHSVGAVPYSFGAANNTFLVAIIA